MELRKMYVLGGLFRVEDIFSSKTFGHNFRPEASKSMQKRVQSR